jgi:release factor glutamine methyltransferase
VLLGDALNSAIQRLTSAQVPSPRLNAELLLMFTLGRDRAYLYGHPEHELTVEERLRYDDALVQRSRGIPAQYITGHQEFWGMDLIVSPAVLIPRPETEHVVETVLGLICDRSVGTGRVGRTFLSDQSFPDSSIQKRSADALRIIDVGTGSGSIALALAKELLQAEIHATDISPAALEIARANAARLQRESRIKFHEADLLAGIERNAFDFVVSNPPYVGESEEDSVQLEVRKFEPRNAVFAGPTGLEVIERLVPQAREVLKPGGWFVIEISGTIAPRIQELLTGWSNVEITNDLQGIARVVAAQKMSRDRRGSQSTTKSGE